MGTFTRFPLPGHWVFITLDKIQWTIRQVSLSANYKMFSCSYHARIYHRVFRTYADNLNLVAKVFSWTARTVPGDSEFWRWKSAWAFVSLPSSLEFLIFVCFRTTEQTTNAGMSGLVQTEGEKLGIGISKRPYHLSVYPQVGSATSQGEKRPLVLRGHWSVITVLHPHILGVSPPQDILQFVSGKLSPQSLLTQRKIL